MVTSAISPQPTPASQHVTIASLVEESCCSTIATIYITIYPAFVIKSIIFPG